MKFSRIHFFTLSLDRSNQSHLILSKLSGKRPDEADDVGSLDEIQNVVCIRRRGTSEREAAFEAGHTGVDF